MKNFKYRAGAPALVLCVLFGCAGDSGDANPSTTKGNAMTDTPVVPPGKNRLALEHSPYLLQHAENPVDWYPWGDEAFAAARQQDKPVFLSIGYSTCHWCHVMEHESFEDSTVAALMNDAFICIKVDREERPDIDNIYMTVCQMMTGRGGWPLTIVMTPDRRPFFAGTYLPRQNMIQLAQGVTDAWTTKRERVLGDATQITDALRDMVASTPGESIGEAELRLASSQLASRYDPTHGGFGTAPKFPTPHNLLFLLRRWQRTGESRLLEMVEQTLERMRRGGMYDHVGYGFHRYSTDERWFLPHFEKMLYDQAMLVMAYTEAFQATENPAYRDTAREIIAYVLRDLSDAAGGFHSAEDADSEGEEGKFYVWTLAELRAALGDDDGVFAATVFGAVEQGNFVEEAAHAEGPTGANVLFLERPLAEQAAALGITGEAMAARVESVRARLFDARAGRVRPGLDDKVLADWNGLMIAALAKAARVFDDDALRTRARRAADFVLETMSSPDGGLYHRYRGGRVGITGMIDDYAFVVWGLIELYETTFETRYLQKALSLSDAAIERFWDDSQGGLFFTASDGEELIARPKEVYDGAIPSGNSVAMLNLVRLARMTARTGYETRARDIGRAFAAKVTQSPSAFTQLLCAVDFIVGPSHEVIIVGTPGSADVTAMTSALARAFLPGAVVVFRPASGGEDVVALAPYTREQAMLDGRATAYVCRDYACELPVNDVKRMLELVGGE